MSFEHSLSFLPEIIVTAAVKYGDLIIMVERPGRHHNVLHQVYEMAGGAPTHGIQGFVTSYGRFVGRETGYEIANMNGQIRKKHGSAYYLFSEDMW